MQDRRELIDDPEEAQRASQDGLQARIWTSCVGIIESVDLDAQTCSVQPAIQGTVTGEDGLALSVNLPLLVDVPLIFPRAGGFAITFPVKKGDECLVSFSARCIDSWWQSGGVQAPLEARMHDLSDGFAILGPTSQPKKLSDVQTDGVEMRTESRSTYFRLTEGVIFIKGDVVHEGNTQQTGTFTADGVKTTAGTGLGTHDHGSGSLISGKTPGPNLV